MEGGADLNYIRLLSIQCKYTQKEGDMLKSAEPFPSYILLPKNMRCASYVCHETGDEKPDRGNKALRMNIMPNKVANP